MGKKIILFGGKEDQELAMMAKIMGLTPTRKKLDPTLLKSEPKKKAKALNGKKKEVPTPKRPEKPKKYRTPKEKKLREKNNKANKKAKASRRRNRK